jgi:hypothetical protein
MVWAGYRKICQNICSSLFKMCAGWIQICGAWNFQHFVTSASQCSPSITQPTTIIFYSIIWKNECIEGAVLRAHVSVKRDDMSVVSVLVFAILVSH